MSYPMENEERIYELGYDKGYEDCVSEMTMKLREVLKFQMMKFCDPKPEYSGLYASDLVEKIIRELNMGVQVGR